MNTDIFVYTLIDRDYNIKTTIERSAALGWIAAYYNRNGEKMNRSVLFSTLGLQGEGVVNLYKEGCTDKDWTVKLSRKKVYHYNG